MTTPQSPVALGANVLRQIGETGVQTVTTLGQQFAQANSTILRQIASGAPPFPLALPIPGLGGNPGNPNGGAGLLPTPASLIPTPALQAIAQLENSVLPAGLPRPAAILLQAIGVGVGPTPPANGNGEREMVPDSQTRREIPARSTGVIERTGY